MSRTTRRPRTTRAALTRQDGTSHPTGSPNTYDLVVADAPYGVQHGSRTAPKGLHRSPLDLIAAAAPAWAKLLRSGGAFGIAWNIKVARRADATDVLVAAGLEPLDSGPYLDFEHRVDQAIVRDILVARRP